MQMHLGELQYMHYVANLNIRVFKFAAPTLCLTSFSVKLFYLDRGFSCKTKFLIISKMT